MLCGVVFLCVVMCVLVCVALHSLIRVPMFSFVLLRLVLHCVVLGCCVVLIWFVLNSFDLACVALVRILWFCVVM